MTAQHHGQLSPMHLICKCGDPDCDWEAAAEADSRRDWNEFAGTVAPVLQQDTRK